VQTVLVWADSLYCRSCVDFTLEVEAMWLNVSTQREQARRETQQWVMRRLPTADSIVEIGRKSRS